MSDERAARIARALGAAGIEARVTVTDNRVRMLSATRQGEALHVRVAAPLVALGDESVEAIVAWASGRRGGRSAVRALLKRIPRTATPPRRAPRPTTAGDHHDLERLMAIEIATYFPDLEAPPIITWGPRRRRKRQRAIRLGSYDPRFSLIRIHRRLDDVQVPGWLVGFVIYHELLHHVLGVGLPESGTRRPLHCAEFRRREAQHHRYAEAMAWEASALPRLLAQED